MRKRPQTHTCHRFAACPAARRTARAPRPQEHRAQHMPPPPPQQHLPRPARHTLAGSRLSTPRLRLLWCRAAVLIWMLMTPGLQRQTPSLPLRSSSNNNNNNSNNSNNNNGSSSSSSSSICRLHQAHFDPMVLSQQRLSPHSPVPPRTAQHRQGIRAPEPVVTAPPCVHRKRFLSCSNNSSSSSGVCHRCGLAGFHL